MRVISSFSSDSDKNNGSTVFGATLNLTNSIIGAGCIGLGASFAQSGGLASLVTILVFAVLTIRSFDMIIALGLNLARETQSSCSSSSSSFEAIGRAAYGNFGFLSVILSKCLFGFGCMVAYFVIIKENAAPALQNLVGVSCTVFSNEGWFTVCVATLLVLPLCLLRDLSRLEISSKLKIAAYGAIATIVTILFVKLRKEEAAQGEGEDIDRNSDWYDHWILVKPGLLPNMGTFTMAFVSQHTVHLVFLSLRNRDRNLAAFSTVSTFAVLSSAIIFLSIGIPVYLSFWESTSSNLFLLYPPSQAKIVNAARLFLSAGMVLTYPMPLFSVRDSLIQMLPESNGNADLSDLPSESSTLLESADLLPIQLHAPAVAADWWWMQLKSDENHTAAAKNRQLCWPLHFLLTTALWGISLATALAAPSLGVVLNLAGCLAGSMLGFLLPGFFWAKLSGWNLSAIVLVSAGFVVGCLGTYYALLDAFGL